MRLLFALLLLIPIRLYAGCDPTAIDEEIANPAVLKIRYQPLPIADGRRYPAHLMTFSAAREYDGARLSTISITDTRSLAPDLEGNLHLIDSGTDRISAPFIAPDAEFKDRYVVKASYKCQGSADTRYFITKVLQLDSPPNPQLQPPP